MRPFLAALLLPMLAALALTIAGCGGVATFVSGSPPPDTTAEAWFARPPGVVRDAIKLAMIDLAMTIDSGESGPAVLVATRDQLPYVGADSSEPAAGRLPFYRVAVALSPAGSDTRVVVTVRGVCPACNGLRPYRWQYPEDVVRAVFERTRDIVNEPHARFAYPRRYRPPAWRPSLGQ